ncbi:MAG: radical SAM protein [Candidatus Omnitrophota bacterium]
MDSPFVKRKKLPDFKMWDKMKEGMNIISFNLELTARCNNNCRHCYINLPKNDADAKKKELTISEIEHIATQAVNMGAVWCLITGGEPLLREDFFEVYILLKKMGLFVSVFTNATLITDRHIDLFKKYPPRNLEVTVYGVTKKTYEKVTRKPGSFEAFMKGLDILLKNKIKVRFKAMALHSNVDELPQIASFCRERTTDYFRFDPFLHMRFDSDKKRNQEISLERLSPDEIIIVESQDSKRFQFLEKNCSSLILSKDSHSDGNNIFYCGAGNSNFDISYEGMFKLCSSLHNPKCMYDLRKGTLRDAWENFVPNVRAMTSNRKEFLEKCKVCNIVNLCLWCPAHAHLECGELDKPIDYFCEVAHARAKMLEDAKKLKV